MLTPRFQMEIRFHFVLGFFHIVLSRFTTKQFSFTDVFMVIKEAPRRTYSCFCQTEHTYTREACNDRQSTQQTSGYDITMNE